ncbi:MAG TPA: rhodanese-like domain-containing protein [Candidatus Polarisedimenticolia bacterium]|nr:rhodanese-like domain-containing protein [Candidatus Polarisedimenticolia bacterium]
MTASVPEISAEEIEARLDDPSLALVDVLPRVSYLAGHLHRAISLPLDEVAARARDVLPDLNQEIAVYCGGFT